MRGNSSIVDEGILVETQPFISFGWFNPTKFCNDFFMVFSVPYNLVVYNDMTYTTLILPISAYY